MQPFTIDLLFAALVRVYTNQQQASAIAAWLKLKRLFYPKP
jgi:hypothetical protein